MIFIRNESFRGYLRAYPLTAFLIAANLFMFLLLVLNGGSQDPETLSRFGALDSMRMVSMADMWRLISSMFLHAGFDHLLFNMFAMFVFAPPLERVFGKWKYLLFYLACGIVGNVLSMVMYVEFFSVGASGAVYGLFGAYLFIVLFRQGALDEQSRKTILVILGLGVIYSFIVPQINVYAHLGGLAAGFILFPSMLRRISTR